MKYLLKLRYKINSECVIFTWLVLFYFWLYDFGTRIKGRDNIIGSDIILWIDHKYDAN